MTFDQICNGKQEKHFVEKLFQMKFFWNPCETTINFLFFQFPATSKYLHLNADF